MITRPSDVPFPPVPVNETLRSLKFENCTGYAGSLDVPRSWMDGAIPSEFQSFGTTSATSDLTFLATSCARLVAPNKIIENYSELVLGPFVSPTNESWKLFPGANFFLFDMFVSSKEVEQQYNAWGFPATLATFKFGELPGQGGKSRTWEVTRNDTRVSFGYTLSNEPGPTANLTNFLWTGKNSYLRASLDVISTDDAAPLGQGVITFEGPSRSSAVVQNGFAEFRGGPYLREDINFIVSTEVFQGGN